LLLVATCTSHLLRDLDKFASSCNYQLISNPNPWFLHLVVLDCHCFPQLLLIRIGFDLVAGQKSHFAWTYLIDLVRFISVLALILHSEALFDQYFVI